MGASGSKCECACGGANHGITKKVVQEALWGKETTMSRRARYEIAEDIPGQPLVIRDLGPWDKHPSVTNDVEAVIEDLVSNGQLEAGRRLFYYDSAGEKDEILVDGGSFVGFRPGPPE